MTAKLKLKTIFIHGILKTRNYYSLLELNMKMPLYSNTALKIPKLK